MNLTLEEISAAVGGKLDGPGKTKVQGYSIDTRTLKPGELFADFYRRKHKADPPAEMLALFATVFEEVHAPEAEPAVTR